MVNSTTTHATTSKLWVTDTLGCSGSSALATDASGKIVCDTDDNSGGGNSFSYPFPSNATTTLLNLNGGIISNASSSISALSMIHSTTTHATTTNLHVSSTASVNALSITGLTVGASAKCLNITTSNTVDVHTIGCISGVNPPLTLSSNTISIPAASASSDGYLSSANFTIFNNKLSVKDWQFSASNAISPTTTNIGIAVNGTSTFATGTASRWNGVFTVDGTRYPKTGAGVKNAIWNAAQYASSTNSCGVVYVPEGTYSFGAGDALHFGGACIKLHGSGATSTRFVANGV